MAPFFFSTFQKRIHSCFLKRLRAIGLRTKDHEVRCGKDLFATKYAFEQTDFFSIETYEIRKIRMESGTMASR